MPNYGVPLAPDYSRSPSMWQGAYADPTNRGKSAKELNAGLPVFRSWEEAIASPYFAGKSDREKTMALQELYGLGQNYDVNGGRLVSNDHSTRNGIIGGSALIGGMFGLEALANGVGGAALGAMGPFDTTSGLATGALGPMPEVGGYLAGTAGGAAAGSGGTGMSAFTDLLTKYGIDVAGKLIGQGMQNSASNYAVDRQMEYYNKALAAAQEEQTYSRGIAADKLKYGQGQYTNYLDRLAPYAAVGPGAAGRMEGLMTGTQSMPQATGTMVQMRAPDGTMEHVPAAHADYYQSIGAQRV